MRRLAVLLVVGFVLICSFQAVEADEIRVLVGSKASWLEKHAARELARYATEITGAEVAVEQADEAARLAACFLIGTPDSNPAIAQLEKEGAVDFSGLTGETDGFLIRSVKQGDGWVVVIGGRPDRATLYGVYHYLEKYHHVGFFWDGEQIPKGPLQMADINEVQVSPFEIRTLGRWNRTVMKKYTGLHDTVNEWKRVLDWQSKSKLNATSGIRAINIEGCGLGGVVAEAFGVAPLSDLPYTGDNSWPWAVVYPNDEYSQRNLEITRYMHALGIGTSCWVPVGLVPKRYKDAHPEKKYIDDKPFLYPSDPDAMKLSAALLRAYINKFGTSHLYSGDAHGESAPGKEPLQLKIEATRRTAEFLRDVDPDPSMIYMAFGWDTIINPRAIWSKRNMRRFLEQLPEHAWCCEFSGDLVPTPFYEVYEGWFGRRWVFGVIGDLGGDDSLHGDFETLLRMAKEVVRKYPNCRGFTIGPENSRLNLPFYDFIARVAWNPEEVDLDKWVDDFCLRRYGPEAAAGMAKAWRAALPAMALKYPGWWVTPRPLYQIINLVPFSWQRPYLERLIPQSCQAMIMDLEALTLTLAERGRVANKELYENDLVDLARTFLHRVTDYYLVEWVRGTERGDAKTAQACENMLFAAMDWVKLILSHRPDYHLATTRDLMASIKGGNPYYEKIVRHNAIASSYDTFDCYEQIEYYYKPLLRAYMAFIRGDKGPTVDEVVENWMSSPLELGEEHVFPGTTVEAVAAMAAWAKQEIDMDQVAREGDRIRENLNAQFEASRKPPGSVEPTVTVAGQGFRDDFAGPELDRKNWDLGRGIAELYDGVLVLTGGLETPYDFECKDWVLEFRANFLPERGDRSVKVRTGDTSAVTFSAQQGGVFLQYPTEGGFARRGVAQADGTWRVYRLENLGAKLTIWVDGEQKGTFDDLALDADAWYLELLNSKGGGGNFSGAWTSAGIRLGTPLLVDWLVFDGK